MKPGVLLIFDEYGDVASVRLIAESDEQEQIVRCALAKMTELSVVGRLRQSFVDLWLGIRNVSSRK
jgi:hypothetical protein